MWWKYSVLMHENEKMRPVENIPGIGREVIKENDEGGELNFCKYHSVSPVQQ
jgi:hypothetical protein